MTQFSLIKKLEVELVQYKNDLLGYRQELDNLAKALENIRQEAEWATAKVNEKVSDAKGSIAFCESVIDQYENALTQLERDEEAYNVG